MTKKTPRILSGSAILAHILEEYPEKREFSVQRASCGQMKNNLRGIPNLFA